MAVELKTTEASETWRAMMTAFTRVRRVLADEMDEATDISLDWYGILLMLSQAEFGAMRPSDLADEMGLSRSATTRLIDRLEERGLVDRRACGTDRRGTFVGLTPFGEKTFREAGRVHLRGIDAHVGTQLSPGELAELRHLLNRLASGVDGNELALLEGSHS